MILPRERTIWIYGGYGTDSSDIMDKVLTEMNDYDYNHYTADDVKRALAKESCGIADFKVLLAFCGRPCRS